MSETPTQDPQETPDETPEDPSSETPPESPPETTPDTTPETRDPEHENEEPQETPWYRRPVPIVLLIVLLLILAVLIPPVVADEVPVGLDEQGQQNAEARGWEEEEGNEPTTALAGLVFVEPKTLLRKNDAGIRDAAYIYTTVKIPAMLPQGFVTDQLRENALERLTERGVDVDFDSHTDLNYDDNGHDTLIDYYTGVAEEDGILLNGTTLDLFIATWRCSVLGSYAVAVGVAAQQDEDGNGLPAEVQEHETADLARLQEIQDDLLAHTKCED